MDIKDRTYYDRLLSQYIDGTISDGDRFVLEKHALDDPFLFESLEGLQNKNGSNMAVIAALKSKVRAKGKENKKRSIPLYNYGIAASLILLLGVGLWFFTDSMNSQNGVALNTQIESSTSGPNRELIPSPDANEEITIAGSQDVSTSGQYDSPKAVISQADNEEEESVSTSSAPPPTQAPKPELENEVVINQEQLRESQPSYRKAKSKIIEPAVNKPIEGPIKEDASVAIAKSDQADTESLSDNTTSIEVFKNDTPTTNVNSQRAKEQFVFPQEEYILSLDKKTLVAPKEGITAFRESFSEEPSQLRKFENNSPDQIVIQFKLNKDGTPTNLEIISGEDQGCINRIVANLKYQGNWVTSPPKKVVEVRFTLPCQ